MRQSSNPFPRGSWIACTGGRVLGVLNRNLVRSPLVIDASLRILVVLADDWEFICQSSFSTQNTSTPTSSNAPGDSPTQPRPVGPGGVASRNPFSSPTRPTKAPPATLTMQSSLAAPPPQASTTTPEQPRRPTTIHVVDDDRSATAPSSGTHPTYLYSSRQLTPTSN